LNRSSWLNLAAATAALTALIVITILVPAEAGTPAVMCAALLVSLVIAFLFLWPRIGRRDSESAQIAMLGPVGTLSGMLLVGAGAALYAALAGHSALSLALDVVTVGGFVAGVSLARVSADTIAEQARIVEAPSQHGVWQSRVTQLVSLCPDDRTRQPLSQLADALRYAARDLPGQAGPENARIDNAIGQLEGALHDKDPQAVLAAVSAIQVALAQREQALKARRSKI
jgi:hypothetical protein